MSQTEALQGQCGTTHELSIGVSPYQCMSGSQSNTIASSAKGGLCVDFEDDIDNGDGGNGDIVIAMVMTMIVMLS